MATIVDGLGGEELGDAGPGGDVGSKVSAIWITGSVTTQSKVIAGDTGSFFGDVHGPNIWGTTSVSGLSIAGDTISGVTVKASDTTVVHISGGSFTDPYGHLRSTGVDNATALYGYRVQAGSAKTGDSSSGVIEFATNFAGSNWFMCLTVNQMSDPYVALVDGSAMPPIISGIRHDSGCAFVAGSQTVVDWIAVGI